MIILEFFQKYIKLVIILSVVVLIAILLFTLPLAKVKTNLPNSLYISGRGISSNETRTTIGLKTIVVTTPEYQPNKKRVFLLPFQSYYIQTENKNNPDSILRQANFTTKPNSKVLASKMLDNGWFVAKSGIDAPDAQVTLVILNFNTNSGQWDIKYQGAGYDETLKGAVPDYVYEYIDGGEF